jgi:hypothetical protein
VTTTSNGTRPHLNAVPHPDEPPPEDGIDTRPPPNDVPAEQAVLGAMMLSRQAILDALEILQPHDFYRPPHEWIWDAIITMHTAGDPVDAVTVSDHLTSTGQLAKIGGAPYLHTLISTVPVAANAGHYARIVADRAANRRLVEAGTRIAQLGYATNGGNVADLQHAATQTLERATTGQPAGGGTASTWQPVDLTPFLYGEQIATVAPSPARPLRRRVPALPRRRPLDLW